MATEKRLIDADLLVRDINADPYRTESEKSYDRCLVYRQPTVDAVEVVHGNWVYYSTSMQECSNCKRHTARHKFKYCPYCGAVMGDKLHYAID